MSRDFTKNAANYLTFPLNALNNVVSPTDARTVVSMHAWARIRSTDTAANNNRIIAVACAADASALILSIDNTTASRKVAVGGRSQSSDTFQTAVGTSDIPLNTWASVGGVVDWTGKLITPYYAGAPENPTSVTFGANALTLGANTVSYDAIGCAVVDIPTAPLTANQFDGQIAEVAIWRTNIGAANFALLAKGYPALRIAPKDLLFYLPLTAGSGLTSEGLTGYVSDRGVTVWAVTATVTGSIPTVVDHPVNPLPNNHQAIGVGDGMSTGERIR